MIRCNKCKSVESSVAVTLINEENGEIYRYRRCNNCGKYFYTTETIMEDSKSKFYKERNLRRKDYGKL